MKLTVKANDETGLWEIHGQCGFVCKLKSESTARELARAVNVLPYMVKALRIWTEHHQRGSDLTGVDVEWTKRVLALAEARLEKEPVRKIDDPPFLP